MKTVFADTFYFIAMLNPKDSAHARAMAFTTGYTGKYVTTRDVLTELADGLSGIGSRVAAGQFIEALPTNKAMRIVWSDEALFGEGLALYLARADKE